MSPSTGPRDEPIMTAGFIQASEDPRPVCLVEGPPLRRGHARLCTMPDGHSGAHVAHGAPHPVSWSPEASEANEAARRVLAAHKRGYAEQGDEAEDRHPFCVSCSQDWPCEVAIVGKALEVSR